MRQLLLINAKHDILNAAVIIYQRKALVGHTPGEFKRGKDTEWDAICGMEEIREFCFKEFAVACLFWNFFVLYYSNNITYQRKVR